MLRDVPFLDPTVVEGIEVVEDRDVLAVSQERIDDVAANESGPTGDQNVHGAR